MFLELIAQKRYGFLSNLDRLAQTYSVQTFQFKLQIGNSIQYH